MIRELFSKEVIVTVVLSALGFLMYFGCQVYQQDHQQLHTTVIQEVY
jgi:hypothetical protein